MGTLVTDIYPDANDLIFGENNIQNVTFNFQFSA